MIGRTQKTFNSCSHYIGSTKSDQLIEDKQNEYL